MRSVLNRPLAVIRADHLPPVRRFGFFAACVATTLAFGCSGSDSSPGANGGDNGLGGAAGSGGASAATGTGGLAASGGATGGANGVGGAPPATGGVMTGGAPQVGGNPATGGTRPAGGSPSNTGGARTGGADNAGGSPSTGGVVATGGRTASGGPTGGAAPTGGKASTGGAVPTGGTGPAGGSKQTGGTSAVGSTAGGAAATGGASPGGSSGTLPCDIYAAANTPCVAAHSTTRALYSAYNGNLYQVRRASDKTTKDIAVSGPGGVANSATQDTFCSGTTCTISEIYDQSANGNHLVKASAGGWLNNGGLEADAAKAPIKLNGHTVYGIYTTMSWDNDAGSVGYRNNNTKGVPLGDNPEAMYMVASGKHYNQYCCFDYGNAETTNHDDGDATMETIYFGNSTQWGYGGGSGPWVMADLENGVFAGNADTLYSGNTSLNVTYVTAMVKGDKSNHWAIKGGDAQSGTLKTMFDGTRPSGYTPMKKQGAIVLGVGGDNSHTGEGTFFEGCLVAGYPTDATDAAVQANVVAAGYGK
jgi:non-reducing end alpha-L-arabinofuranosidase